MLRRSKTICLISLAALGVFASVATARPTAPKSLRAVSLTREAGHVMHTAHFIPMRDGANSCQQFTAPEPVSTREPLDFGSDATARLNFVVNANGQVNGVVILGVNGQLDQQALVEAVIGWRFRPATCDGAPVDSEATLDLESRR